MFSIKPRDLLSKAQNDPKKLGYLANSWILLEILDEINKPQRVETIECKIIQELTEGCIKM